MRVTFVFTLVHAVRARADLVARCTGQSESLDALQCAAWQDLYDSTGGENWTQHCKRADPCDCGADYISCSGGISKIELASNNLQGSIPTSIGRLTYLLELVLSYNKLTGTIPESIGQLTTLSVANLLGNSLRGTIPSTFGKLQSLYGLSLGINKLTGTIPNLGKLRALMILDLHSNSLAGSIPSSLGRLEALADLYLYDNMLNGTVPALPFSKYGLCGIGGPGNTYCRPLPADSAACDLQGPINTKQCPG
jgi:hypothetical protein